MSADAKVWLAEDTKPRHAGWRGLHDGPITESCVDHWEGTYSLVECLQAIHTCMGQEMRWEPCVYPDGKVGLRGWMV